MLKRPFVRRASPEQEEWQLSLADMMTLILTFFVILVSISVVDVERYEEVSESFKEGLARKPVQQLRKDQPKEQLPESEPVFHSQSFEQAAREEEKKKPLDTVYEDLAARFSGETYSVSLERRPHLVAVNLRGSVLFDPGAAELTPKARAILTEVGDVLWGLPYRFVIEGHSDNTPIHTERFPSNWELSAARASSVARYLMERGFPPDRFTVVGKADTQPMAPNEDEAGRPVPRNQLLNRRVVVLVEPEN
ncbi:MAG: OmpA family protein [Thermodesulfobacteriota bacterium]